MGSIEKVKTSWLRKSDTIHFIDTNKRHLTIELKRQCGKNVSIRKNLGKNTKSILTISKGKSFYVNE